MRFREEEPNRFQCSMAPSRPQASATVAAFSTGGRAMTLTEWAGRLVSALVALALCGTFVLAQPSLPVQRDSVPQVSATYQTALDRQHPAPDLPSTEIVTRPSTDFVERLARLEGHVQAAAWVLGIVALVLVALFGIQTYNSYAVRAAAIREIDRVHDMVNDESKILKEKREAADGVLKECQKAQSEIEAKAKGITNQVCEIVYKALRSWPGGSPTDVTPVGEAHPEATDDGTSPLPRSPIQEISEQLADSSLYAALMGARSYLQAGNSEAALKLLRKAESAGGDSSEFHFLCAEALIADGNPDQARRELRKAEGLEYPDRASILRLYFESYMIDKDYGNAECIADKGRKDFPKDFGFVDAKGLCLAQTGTISDAVLFWDGVISDEFLSRHAHTWSSAGRALLASVQRDVVERGIRYLQKAKELNDKDNLPYTILGDLYFARGDFGLALAEYKGALVRLGAGPPTIEAIFETNIARALACQGLRAEAERHFRHAVDLAYHPDSVLGLCEVLLAKGESTQSLSGLLRLDTSKLSDGQLAHYHLLRAIASGEQDASEYRQSSDWLKEHLSDLKHLGATEFVVTDYARRALAKILNGQ